MEPGQIDERLDYLSAYIQKTLKLKPEKWTKMMAQVSYRVSVLKIEIALLTPINTLCN
jgi:hypothetical protein